MSGCSFGDIETVERIEQGEAVALREKVRLPFAPGRLAGARLDGFNDDDFGPMAPPVAAGEDIGLRAFHIDLEEIDLGKPVAVAEFRERHHRHADAAIIDAEFPCVAGDRFDGRRKAVQAVDDMEIDLARCPADHAAHRDVPRPQPLV